MSQYPLFGTVEECPKCGSGWRSFDRKYWYSSTSSIEFISVRCISCGYEWREHCKDYKEDK